MNEPNPPVASPEAPAHGLTSEEAARRLQRQGPNALPEEKPNPWLRLASRFWAPVPWMLEITIVIELLLHKRAEALIIGILLVFNALLSFVQEGRAQNALALLRSRLAVNARVLRDGRWQMVPAANLVDDDFVHVRMGDLVPADLEIAEGNVELDQSALTGESLPVDASAGNPAYSGSVVKRGEASGRVTATGTRTFFGKTAELVGTARTVSHLQEIIFRIVRYMLILDAVMVAALLVYAPIAHLPWSDVLPFALILLVASVPVALPATFTLATALGALELARRGVLVTRLSAIEEAAAMEVLCVDKTGTVTESRLSVAGVAPNAPFTEGKLLQLAAIACDEATQDPIDLAILAAARAQGDTGASGRLQFIPFDPATKYSEGIVEREGKPFHVVKGAPAAVGARLSQAMPMGGMEPLAAQGYRVLAVAAGEPEALEFAGFVALEDPPRPDSADLIRHLVELGLRVIMITGDSLATARAVAAKVGIGNRACTGESLRNGERDGCDVFAGVFPEDKFRLVQSLQQGGRVCGMTGDGVNDAPALKQAEVGIAVATATDVAKAAASVVLTRPGLSEIAAAVETSRRIYQRMLTYTLNKIIKTVEIAVFLSVGVMLTGTFVITPMLIVLLLFTNDFVTMSIATDQVAYSLRPDRWRIRRLMATGAILAGFVLVLSFSVFFVGRDWLHLPLAQLQTLIFVMLVFTGQGNVYLVRSRGHFWDSRPSRWLLLASVLDILVVSTLAARGILMAAIPGPFLLVLGALVVAYLFALDFVKIAVFRRVALR
ncbi:MAG: plasma-membrane proton-efflux P-type ATPase [Betaproteobacteria bacterium]|nr:plasma-membrane proton-efflux P-type ATPase [Betaproteobacteria bacterium]